MNAYLQPIKRAHRNGWLAMVIATGVCGLTQTCTAAPSNDAFYHQLLKLQVPEGYSPTRTFTIITDAEHGNKLVAEDDDNLRFNLLWMQQFHEGYKAQRGGAAFGEIFRSYVKTAYKSYRQRNAQSMNALPDENGSIKSFANDMDYNVKVTGDEVRFKVQYSF